MTESSAEIARKITDSMPMSIPVGEFRTHLKHAEAYGYAEGYQAALAAVASGPCYDDECVLGNTTHDSHVYADEQHEAKASHA